MLLKFLGKTINQRHIDLIAEKLKDDGVIIIPTDSVYALATGLNSRKGFEKICRIKNIKPDAANFSILCRDLSNISFYTIPFSREVFRLMKRTLPGPFTYILNANSNVPDIFRSKKKTIGIRVPDNAIALSIVEALDSPLIVTSLHDDAEDYLTDPFEIEDKFGTSVDFVVDGGPGEFLPSTVIDCTSDEPVVLREGKGKL